jgi:Heterokaryon incompatibility protein (HET)
MEDPSLYRPLREQAHEIRLLVFDSAEDRSDDMLNCRLEYVMLTGIKEAENHKCSPMEIPDDLERWQRIPESLLTADFTTTPLDKVTPPFIALSYTWGNEHDTVPIFIQNTEKLVTRNLRDALVAVQSQLHVPKIYLWADALCINQADVAERNREVQRMSEVYRSASLVLIWPGSVL